MATELQFLYAACLKDSKWCSHAFTLRLTWWHNYFRYNCNLQEIHLGKLDLSIFPSLLA